MRSLWPFSMTAFALGLQLAHARQATGLEALVRVVQEALNGQGRVNWVQTTRNSPTEQISASVKVSSRVSDTNIDVNSCVLSFRQERNFPDYQIALSWKLPFQEIREVEVVSLAQYANRISAAGGHPERVLTTDSPVVLVQIHAPTGKKFAGHRWSLNSAKQVIENDVTISPASVILNDEDAAQRFAKALLGANEVCTPKQ